MSPHRGAAGPRGLALLAVTGIAGVVLAVHGWSHRGAGAAPGSLAASATRSQPGSASAANAPTSARSGPTAASGPSATPATQGPPTSQPPVHTTAPASSPGPLLASQPYAQYAFVIWPGTPSSTARAALTGLSVTVHRQAAGISVTAAANGQQGVSHFYPRGAHVYVVEATMGDDSGSSDYNLGDDGIVVTDAHGRIIS